MKPDRWTIQHPYNLQHLVCPKYMHLREHTGMLTDTQMPNTSCEHMDGHTALQTYQKMDRHIDTCPDRCAEVPRAFHRPA